MSWADPAPGADGPGEAAPGAFVAPATAPSSRTGVRPSGYWYLLAGGLALGGLVLGFMVLGFGFLRALERLDDLPSVSAVDGGEVSIDAGPQTLYAVGPRVDDATPIDVEDVSVLDPDGEPVPLVTRTDPLTIPGAEGDVYLPRFVFEAPEDGTYEIVPADSTAVPVQVDRFAVGPEVEDVLEDVIPWAVAGGGAALLGFVAGGVVAIVLAVKRGRAKRSARLGVGPPPGAGPPGPPGPSWAPPPSPG